MTTVVSFHDIVARHANERPDAVYVYSIDQDKGLTFGQLRAVSDDLAVYLAEVAIDANDRVLLLAREQRRIPCGVRRRAAVRRNHRHRQRRHEPCASRRESSLQCGPSSCIVQAGIGVDALARSGGRRCIELGKWQPHSGDGLFGEIASRGHGDGCTIRRAPRQSRRDLLHVRYGGKAEGRHTNPRHRFFELRCNGRLSRPCARQFGCSTAVPSLGFRPSICR